MSPPAVRSRATGRAVAAVVATLLGLVLLWILLGVVLKTSRGLDLTDEGFYLLAADPPNASAAWGFPFGWHTHPLFALVGYDIASFRTLGAIILVLSSGWLGWLAARTVRSNDDSVPAGGGWLLPSLSAVGSGLASLLYYVSMLRTPSYNWLCLVGITLASCGLLLVARRANRRAADPGWRALALPAAVTSAALFMTIPAKPSVLPMVLLLGLGLLLLLVSWSTAWRWLALAVAFIPIWVLLSVVTTMWPLDFASVLRRGLQMPFPDPSQTPSVAIREALLAPRAAAAAIGELGDGPALLLLAGAVLLALPLLLRRRWLVLRAAGMIAVTVDALGIAGVPVPGVNAGGKPFGLAQTTLTTALLLLLIATMAATWGLGSRSARLAGLRLTRGQLACVLALFLLVLTLVFAFGSDNGIYGQAAVAGGLLLIAALAIALGVEDRRECLVAVLAVLVSIGLFVGAGLVGGWRFPQRQAPLAEQTVSTVVGAHGANLMLDKVTADTLEGLRQQAVAQGWQQGTPLVDVSYTWHPGVAYALGARVPDSLMLTIFGYGAAHDIATFHLQDPYLEFPFADAWLMTSTPAEMDEGARSAVDATMQQLTSVSGRSFPGDYVCAASGDFILWQPLPAGEKSTTACGW